MNLRNVNTYTGDTSKAVETEVSVVIGATDTYTFNVVCSRESAAHLTHEDWARAKSETQTAIDAKVNQLLLGGVYFDPDAPALLRQFAEHVMRTQLYRHMRTRQNAKGNMAFQIDPLLKGKEYQV